MTFNNEDGLRAWPVLLNDAWAGHASEPCAVLFGRSQHGYESLKYLAGLDLPSRWPRLQQFSLGGACIVLAPSYSESQALLLAEDINRQLREVQSPLKRDYSLTWGVAIPEATNWSMSAALAESISLTQRAEQDGRVGSIHMAESGWQNHPHPELVVCAGSDAVTGLCIWGTVAAWRLDLDGEPLALLMGDVDGLKRLNDQHGFPMGDAALVSIASVLRTFQCPKIAAFRSGGDEFVVWARGVSLDEARKMTEAINERLKKETISVPYLETTLPAPVLTWGVVSSTEGKLEAMLRQADDLIGAAKTEGRRGSVNSEVAPNDKTPRE